jgi:hypothetical protein
MAIPLNGLLYACLLLLKTLGLRGLASEETLLPFAPRQGRRTRRPIACHQALAARHHRQVSGHHMCIAEHLWVR